MQIVDYRLQIQGEMKQEEMKKRIKDFAEPVITLCRRLPDTREERLIGNQLFRSGTSGGANYRAAYRARSKAEFVAKLGIVLEEADESLYWLEIIAESQILQADSIAPLIIEAGEVVAILASSLKTAKSVRKQI